MLKKSNHCRTFNLTEQDIDVDEADTNDLKNGHGSSQDLGNRKFYIYFLGYLF
jgi:hypothetical protein